MRVLVLNCGSSSVKFQVYDRDAELCGGMVDRIGQPAASLAFQAGATRHKETREILDHRDAILAALGVLTDKARGGVLASRAEIEAVGHRVVHGGEHFHAPAIVTPEVEAAIEDCISLAPLHNPANLSGIRVCRELLPGVPHVAVFDTAFHQTMPPRAFHYALPRALYQRHKIRRYGFHGTSHQYVDERVRDRMGRPGARVVTCHLGNGASMAAIAGGRSLDTSMGLTPLEGLVMGTRCGDIDPSIVLYAMAEDELDAAQTQAMLSKHSGLYGLSGLSGDMRELEAASAKGDERAALAIEVFCYRVRKYLGAYAAVLGGLDAVVFTGGIGENSALVRARVLEGLDWLGLALDPEANGRADPAPERRIDRGSADDRGPQAWVIRTREELVIARACRTLAAGSGSP